MLTCHVQICEFFRSNQVNVHQLERTMAMMSKLWQLAPSSPRSKLVSVLTSEIAKSLADEHIRLVSQEKIVISQKG